MKNVTDTGSQAESLVSPLTDEQAKSPVWVLTVDGKVVEYHQADLTHPDFASVQVGLRPEGYPGFVIAENGGGGSVIVPYALIDGELYIGMVQQARVLQSKVPIWNVPRGFLRQGESPLAAAIREQDEEFGFTNAELRILPIPGVGANPNSAFYVTVDTPGVTYTAFRMFDDELELVADESVGDLRVFAIKEGLAEATDKAGEGILQSRFFHWTIPAQVGDMFSNSGTVRLQAAIALGERGFTETKAEVLQQG